MLTSLKLTSTLLEKIFCIYILNVEFIPSIIADEFTFSGCIGWTWTMDIRNLYTAKVKIEQDLIPSVSIYPVIKIKINPSFLVNATENVSLVNAIMLINYINLI